MKKIFTVLIIHLFFLGCYSLDSTNNNYLLSFLNDFQNLFINSERTDIVLLSKEEQKAFDKKVREENEAVVQKWSKIKNKININKLIFLKHFDEYATVYLKYMKLKRAYDEQQAYVWEVINGRIEVSLEELENAFKIYHDAEIYYESVYNSQCDFFKYANLITEDWKKIIEKQPEGNIEIAGGVKKIIDLSLVVKNE